MAKTNCKVLLGFEDEAVTEKYKSLVDYTTNKIGGRPDWPSEPPPIVKCKLCGLHVPLVLQIYAPLDNSPYHRTLYIFACINPNCWNQQGSWICLRVQVPDPSADSSNTPFLSNGRVEMRDNPTDTEWCSGSENWGEDEENGNTVIEETMGWEETCIGELNLDEDKNANASAASEGASGTVAARATAVIEGEEGEVVCIDTPTKPQVNILALLEEAAPLPQVPVSSLEFKSWFMSVCEEETLWKTCEGGGNAMYEGGEEDGNGETYEKSIPPHGDKLTHALVRRLEWAPGQLLRYGGVPLPLAPLPTRAPLCRFCSRPTAPELQVLPTLVSKLRLLASPHETHLEFGTVILYSCKSSCWDTGTAFREEILLVQPERI